jgi:S1-C subfamily serine protease
VAVPLARSPYPTLVSEVDRSSIVTHIDAAMPDSLRHVYSSLQSIIDQSGFPQVFGNFQTTHIVSVGPPQDGLASAAGIGDDHASVLKVYGAAPRCGKAIEGSGFVYAPGLVLTNAHVVAGTNQVEVELENGDTKVANVVVYDPERDVAVLSVPGLKETPLQFATAPAKTDDDAIVLGYPGDGEFTIGPSRIREQDKIKGHDIYGQGQITREIYSIRGVVRSGNSGGPLITPDGRVLGIVFATALDSDDTGFVLTDSEIMPDAVIGRTATEKVSTGNCTSG